MISSEKEVLEIKDFYKSILDNIIDGVWVTNADDIIYYTNKGMENIAGIPAKQIVGSHVLKDFPESTLKYFRPYYQKAKDTLKSVFYDAIPVRTPSGMHSYQSGWLIPRIKEGKYDGIICTVDDVTERKEAEEKLKKSELQLREINVELDQRVEERTIKLKESEHNLKERVKELSCLYGISQLFERSNISLDEIFKGTLDLIPLAWQFPELTSAKIIYDTKTFQTDNFKETKSNLTTSVRINEKLLEIKVYYLEDQPFVEEEKYLISDIGNRLKAIIEQKESRNRMEKERNNLINILNTMGSGVYIVNYQYDVEFINPALERELGPLNGKKCYDYFLNRSEPCPDCANKSIFEGETLRQEFFTSKINKTFEIISTPLLNPDGSISKLGIFYDITERKIAEQELDASEIKYRTIFEEALNPILIVGENNKYIDVNKAACEFLESDKEEILCKIVWDYTPPSILEEQKSTHAPFYSRRTLETEYLVNGKIKTLLLNVVPFEVAGKKFLYGIGQNITDRLKAEQKLKESEERWRSITNYTPDNIMQIDLDGNILFINHTVPDLSIDEVIGKPIYQFVPEKYRENVKKTFARVLSTGEPDNYETGYRDKVGNDFFFEAHVGPIWESGKILGFITSSTDITNRKKAELKLKESEEKFRSIFEHAALGISLVAPDGSFIKVNQKFCGILKYSQEELLSFSFPEITHPDDLEESIIAKNKLLDGEILTYSTEKRYKCKDKSIVWVNLTTALLRDSLQKPKYFITIIDDISDKKELEEERNKFFNLPLHLLIIAGLDGIIKRVNPGWTERLGYEAEELEGKNFLELVHPDDRAATIGEMDKLSKGITTFHFENRYRHKKGNYRTLAWAATSDPEKGVIYAIAYDITERKIAESLIHLQRDIALKFSLGSGLEEFARFCVENIIQIEELDYCGIYLVEQSSGDLNLLFSKGMSKESTHGLKRIKADSPRMLLVMEGKQKYTNLENLCVPIDNNLQNEELNAVALIPIIYDNEIIGCLNVASRTLNEMPVFLRNTLETIANQIGSIITTINTTMKLKDSEEKYSNLFQYSNDAIILHDIEGNIVDVNQKAIEWFGYTKAEFIKMKIFELHPSEDLEISQKALKDIKKDKFANFEIRFKIKNGEKFSADVSSKIIKIEDKTIIQGEIRDITDRKNAELKLRESEEKYRFLIENVQEGIWAIDESSITTFVNPKMCKLFGYNEEEMIGRHIFSFMDKNSEKLANYYLKRRELGIKEAFEFQFIKKNGKVFYTKIETTPIFDDAGNYKGALGVVSDITERKKAVKKIVDLARFPSENPILF